MHLPFIWLFVLYAQSIAEFITTDIFEDFSEHSTEEADDMFKVNETELDSTFQPNDELKATNIDMSMSSIQSLFRVECNRSASGFLYYDTTVYIDFNVTNTMDVVITNCPSYHWVYVSDCDKLNGCSEVLQRAWDWDLDTEMYLENSDGIDITSESYNFCDGDNCWVPDICRFTRAETLVMKDLPPDQYRLELFPKYNDSDSFQVNVSCGDFSNLTSIWDAYHCDDPDPSLSDPSRVV